MGSTKRGELVVEPQELQIRKSLTYVTPKHFYQFRYCAGQEKEVGVALTEMVFDRRIELREACILMEHLKNCRDKL